MQPPRSVIDYALARRAVLADLFAGRVTTSDVCDAHPYLLRAAKYHGEAIAQGCPVCRREPLTQVTYVYGDDLKERSGSARSTGELAGLAAECGELSVYLVEVCRGCSWNHLRLSYRLGNAALTARRTRRRPAHGDAAQK